MILGAGGWGTAVAVCLAKAGRRVTLWDRDPAFADALRDARENTMFLPGIPVPESVEVVSGAPPAGDVYTVAVPTQYVRGVMTTLLKGKLDPDVPFVSLSKGIEQKTLLRPTEILAETAGAKRLAVLSGPSHAEEVGRGMPATVVLASEPEDLATRLRPIFHMETLRIYTGGDPVGVEYAAALKNVLAIAAGICEGLGFGDNAKSALISRG
ncbi:MAG: NAD(P)H-dependent glycerol-3-phosphate dehydrogenase, partial [Planctomycetota bacterium]